MSSSFAFSPSTTAPSKFVLHGSGCKCSVLDDDNGTSVDNDLRKSSISRGQSACPVLVSSDPLRPQIESILINSSNKSSAVAICPIASSWLRTSLANAEGDNVEANDKEDDEEGSIGVGSNDTSPEIWMKKIQDQVTQDKNNVENTINNNNVNNHNIKRYEIYRHLYNEYSTLFKATYKRFHIKILENLYCMQVQKAVRSLVLIRHGTDYENKAAKFLWIQYPRSSSSFNTNVNPTSKCLVHHNFRPPLS